MSYFYVLLKISINLTATVYRDASVELSKSKDYGTVLYFVPLQERSCLTDSNFVLLEDEDADANLFTRIKSVTVSGSLYCWSVSDVAYQRSSKSDSKTISNPNLYVGIKI